eukprot:jgi/Botrbrau1/15415/Bobra.43_2s0041.1
MYAGYLQKILTRTPETPIRSHKKCTGCFQLCNPVVSPRLFISCNKELGDSPSVGIIKRKTIFAFLLRRTRVLIQNQPLWVKLDHKCQGRTVPLCPWQHDVNYTGLPGNRP